MAIKKKKTSVPRFRPGAGRRTPTTSKDVAKTRKATKKKTTRRERP